MRFTPTARAASNMASTSACEKSFPHSPPNCQVPIPMTETRRFVLPKRRYFMVSECSGVVGGRSGLEKVQRPDEVPRPTRLVVTRLAVGDAAEAPDAEIAGVPALVRAAAGEEEAGEEEPGGRAPHPPIRREERARLAVVTDDEPPRRSASGPAQQDEGPEKE